MIHRYWSGPVTPVYVSRFGAQLRALHPSWEVHDWSLTSLPTQLIELCRPSTANVRGHEAVRHVANVSRYWLLHEYGGVWVDCDVMPVRPFDDLVSDRPFFASLNGNLEGAFIGGPARHPVFARLVDASTRVPPPLTSSVHASGAAVLNATVDRSEVDVLPSRAMYRHDAAGVPMDGPLPAGGAYGDHFWASSRLGCARIAGTATDLRPFNVPGRLHQVIPAVTLRPLVDADRVWLTDHEHALFTADTMTLVHVVHLAEQPVGLVGVQAHNDGPAEMTYRLTVDGHEFLGEIAEHMGFLAQQHADAQGLLIRWNADGEPPAGLRVVCGPVGGGMWSTRPDLHAGLVTTRSHA